MTQFSNPLLQLNKAKLEADQDSDQTLIARFVQKQDQAAFELLVKRFEKNFGFAPDPILRIDSEVVGWNSIVSNLGFRARLSAKDRTKIESIQFTASNAEPDEMEVGLESEDAPNSID